MTDPRQFSLLDQLIAGLDKIRRNASGISGATQRASPAAKKPECALDEQEKKHATGLMRVNHTGEVCAQALYRGQAMTARLNGVRENMERAAAEEIDHLAWCAARIEELGGEPSKLNPLFYMMSFGLGAATGALGDRWSLGFVAATEQQVCQHLREHIAKLPAEDERSRAILEQMLTDEERHGLGALDAGGMDFSPGLKAAMTLASRLMTRTTYHI